MNIPENLRYSKDHEWVLIEGNIATIGITDYAQQSLGDIVYVELPRVGEVFNAHDPCGSVESVKAVSEVFTPVSGEVIEINQELNESPEVVNKDPYGQAWMVKLKISDSTELDSLMTASEYEEYLNNNT